MEWTGGNAVCKKKGTKSTSDEFSTELDPRQENSRDSVASSLHDCIVILSDPYDTFWLEPQWWGDACRDVDTFGVLKGTTVSGPFLWISLHKQKRHTFMQTGSYKLLNSFIACARQPKNHSVGAAKAPFGLGASLDIAFCWCPSRNLGTAPRHGH